MGVQRCGGFPLYLPTETDLKLLSPIKLLIATAIGYSHSSAPFFHSYTNPTVRIKRNINIDQKPKSVILFKVTAHGNRKLTSKSKIINKMATK